MLKCRKIISILLIITLAVTMMSVQVFAFDVLNVSSESQISSEAADASAGEIADKSDSEAADNETSESGVGDEALLGASIDGNTVSGSFAVEEGKDIATVRYYTDADRTTYKFASFTKNGSSYSFSFEAPYSGYNANQGTSYSSGANIIAEYYSTTKWDGAVDTSWYDASATSYTISNPAEFAGLAAIVNGSINSSTPIYRVKGARSDLSKEYNYNTPQTSKKQNINEGLPDCIESKYIAQASLPAGVKDEAYSGLAKNDFSNKTVYISADLDMGGVEGSEIDHSNNATSNAYDYPNWTPIGGEYLMGPSDASTMIIASFNGVIDGCGHDIKNLYCYRWSYASVADTAYGYAQGTALVGMMGSMYEDEENPTIMPGLKNMSLSGYIYGRRMVGGFVGCLGGGSNAASGTSVAGGITMENLANHAYAYCTDSKGLGGIIGCSMVDKGSIINCYNTGKMCAYYAAPTGGIIGSNEGMDIFCCYNTGVLNTNGNTRGRGIGCDNSGKNYTVNDCYYLDTTPDDTVYPGYYTYNIAPSVSVNTTEIKAREITDGTLLNKLNVNGLAYVADEDGKPVLYWEKNGGTTSGGNLTLNQTQGGAISASKTGSMYNGSIVYLTAVKETGWNFKNFLLNGEQISGSYVTVNGDSTVSGYFETAKAGVLKIEQSKVVNISVKKDGTIIDESGQAKTVTDYAVSSGDNLYEGDVLTVTATLKDGVIPDDPGKAYKAAVGASNPFRYDFTYTDGSTKKQYLKTFTVDSTINNDGTSLTLAVEAMTTDKLWSDKADTSWYNDSLSSFTLTTAEQLGGLARLVDNGTTFEGKTINLGCDISLENSDGSGGMRYWNGIGEYSSTDSSAKPFKGTFDGRGYTISNLNAKGSALFTYCMGTESNAAIIKNVKVKGSISGTDACGIAAYAKYAEISGCESYVVLEGNGGHTAGITGYALPGTTIKQCNNYANISGKGYVGGICGEVAANTTVKSTVSKCINRGNVKCTDIGGNDIGGIAGCVSGTLSECGNYGDVYAASRYIGGVAGASTSKLASIDSCYNVGNVTYENGTYTDDTLGGIIGYGSFHSTSNCFNYGSVEKISGTMTGYIGAVIGKESQKSTNVTDDVYFLDTSCEYAENSTEYDALPSATYTAGIKKSDAAGFNNAGKVMAAINDTGDFVLGESGYPELKFALTTHVHNGGTADCTHLAVCEECGLEYGRTDSENHTDLKIINSKKAVWNIDGYTGDNVCGDCGEVIEKGSAIKADTAAEAITLTVKSDAGESVRTYTVAQFDALKTTSSVVYGYGGTSTTFMIATEYVTLDKLLEDQGLSPDEISKIVVVCDGGKSEIDKQTLKDCDKYYSGTEVLSAPAAFGIKWCTASGSISEAASETVTTGDIRFGYGISKAQHDEGTELGGKRMVSPVRAVEIYVSESSTEADISGSINGVCSGDTASLTLTESGKEEPTYTTSGSSSYKFENVPNGEYTLNISGEGDYINNSYNINVSGFNVVQNVNLCKLGDVDMNGERNASDITALARHVAKISLITDTYNIKLLDTTREGGVTAEDITHLARFVAKIIEKL